MAAEQHQQPFPQDTCRSCNAPIIWAYTATKRMPVDAEPSTKGTVELRWEAGTVRATVLGAAKAFGRRDLRTSHFATCPDAAGWRKRRGTTPIQEPPA